MLTLAHSDNITMCPSLLALVGPPSMACQMIQHVELTLVSKTTLIG